MSTPLAQVATHLLNTRAEELCAVALQCAHMMSLLKVGYIVHQLCCCPLAVTLVCHLFDSQTMEEVSSYDMSSDAALDCTALLLCVLYRVGSDWYMYAIGEGAHGKMAKDNVDELQDFLTAHDLQNQTAAKPPSTQQQVKLKAPPKKGGYPRKVMFNTPGKPGCKQEVTIPAHIEAGQVVEVPLVDVVVL